MPATASPTPPTLRQRRRAQTSRDIRLAALELCQVHGFDAVTTEAISARAGVSLRTFFNYYPNKVAAVMARPSGFPTLALTAFETGHGSLGVDLTALLRAYLDMLDHDRDAIRLQQDLLRDNPALRAAHDASVQKLQSDLANSLAHRLPGHRRPVLDLFAATVMQATEEVLRTMQDTPRLADRAPDVWAMLGQISALIRQEKR